MAYRSRRSPARGGYRSRSAGGYSRRTPARRTAAPRRRAASSRSARSGGGRTVRIEIVQAPATPVTRSSLWPAINPVAATEARKPRKARL